MKVPDVESAVAVVRDGVLSIRVDIEALPNALQMGCSMGYVEGSWRVTDPVAFAVDVARALNAEDEQGVTAIHRLLDNAFERAIGDGADGVEAAPTENS